MPTLLSGLIQDPMPTGIVSILPWVSPSHMKKFTANPQCTVVLCATITYHLQVTKKENLLSGTNYTGDCLNVHSQYCIAQTYYCFSLIHCECDASLTTNTKVRKPIFTVYR